MKFLNPMTNLIKMIGIFIVSGVLINPNDQKMMKIMEDVDCSIDKCKKVNI
jgi:hypothetical protein